MSRPALKWGDVERYCRKHGFTIKGAGGEKIIQAPRGDGKPRARQQERIGHTSCANPGTQVLSCYIGKLERLFGCKLEDIINS